MNIERLREYFSTDTVVITNHAAERIRQRNIRIHDVKSGVMTGVIIEEYPHDFPYPSCLILGYIDDTRAIHIVMSDEGTGSRIITAYIPTDEKWENDFRTRKE